MIVLYVYVLFVLGFFCFDDGWFILDGVWFIFKRFFLLLFGWVIFIDIGVM